MPSTISRLLTNERREVDIICRKELIIASVKRKSD
jgi:hypothetical protein